MKKLAFVIPWYGADIGGGAETELRGIVENLAKKEIPVEVLTTCVKQFQSDWGHNYHPEGEEMINGVLTRRFPVRKRNAYAFDKVNIHLMHGEMVSPMDQEIYMDEFVNSQALYNYIRDHQDEYAYFIYIPYMFPTTYYGILAAPEKSVMIPCFHEEAYIHMDIYKKAFEQSRGFLFLSKPEMELANEVFDIQDAKQLVLGAGVDTDANYDAESFRNKYQITEPFILYAGRKDEGKNIYLLLDYFAKWKHEYKKPLKLVLIGGGKVNIPHSVKEDVIDLGFLPLEDKSNAYAAATFLAQPSIHESFSIVIMESWLAKRPVLVHSDCAVTKNFVEETQGGKYFKTYDEFKEAVNFFLSEEEENKAMGERGREYVLKNFSWDGITNHLMEFLEDLEKKQMEHTEGNTYQNKVNRLFEKAKDEAKEIKDTTIAFDHVSYARTSLPKGIELSEFDEDDFYRSCRGMIVSGTNSTWKPIAGNPIKVFIKKIIRKIIRNVLEPIVEQQNAFNDCTIKSMMQVRNYTSESKQEIEELRNEVAALKEVIAELKKEGK